MLEVTQEQGSQDVTPEPTAPKVTRKRKDDSPSAPRNVAFSSIHVAFAKRKGVDVTKAAKLNRSYIRSNFDAVAKVWPELRKAQKVNRDGNRYPTVIPAKVATMIVNRAIPQAK
jgi:hypothetical protein